MGLKYNKNDGQLLSSALKHNLEVSDQIISDVQEGVNHLLGMLDDPFGGLSGKAYHAAGTLFKAIVKPALDKLKEASQEVQGELRTFDYERSNFDTFPDAVYDKADLERHLEIKRQQKAMVEMQMHYFSGLLSSSLAKKALEDFLFEGQRLQRVADHYNDEIRDLEAKLRILEDFSGATASLFQNSLHTFQNALNGAKALKTGSFDSQGNFSLSSSSDLSWYKKMTGKDISRDLVHEPTSITANDVEMAEIDNMNAETRAQLEQIAKATGMTIAQVLAMYARASKNMAVKGGEAVHNVWDFIAGEFAKIHPENRVKDSDVIKTIVYFTNSGELKVVYNETQNVVLSFGGGLMANMENFNGSGVDAGGVNGVEYVTPSTAGLKQSILNQNDFYGDIEYRLSGLDNFISAMKLKDSYHTEEKGNMSGKEYLDKIAKEKERKRQEEAIKAQQRISGGGNPATLGS